MGQKTLTAEPPKKAPKKRLSRKKVDMDFIEAICADDLRSAEACLAQGADINTMFPDRDGCLSYAIKEGKKATFDFCLKQKSIDVDEAFEGFSPLYTAIQRIPQVGDYYWKELLKHNAKVDQIMSGWSCLTACIDCVPTNLELLEKVATPETIHPKAVLLAHQPIQVALRRDAHQAFQFLINKKVSLESPLTEALRHGAYHILKFLLQSGMAPKDLDEEGNSLLMRASSNNSVEVAKLLIQHGCSIDHVNNVGDSALFLAVRKSDAKLVEFLLKSGCNKKLVNHKGENVAFELATPSTLEIAKILEKYKVDFQLRNLQGESVLDLCEEKLKVVKAPQGRLPKYLQKNIQAAQKDLNEIKDWLSDKK